MSNIFCSDIIDVIIQIEKRKHLIAVSDGSVKAKHMTFRWILADDRGQVITQGYGPTNGRPSSLRSEAAGMLAVSIFLDLF